MNKIKIKISVAEEQKNDVTVSVNGKTLTLSDLEYVSPSIYQYTGEALFATEFGKSQKFALLYKGEEQLTLHYSVNAYTYAILTNETVKEAMKDGIRIGVYAVV